MALMRRKGLFESNRVQYIPVTCIVPNPGQPRKNFAEEGLLELAASIKEYGVMQPLSVRKTGVGYELISGERRLRASKLAGLTDVPCIICNVDREGSSLLALVENLQRRDLDFLEEATALQRLIRTYSLSQDEAAKRIGKSQSSVANKLRLLRLPPAVLDLLQENRMTERHARALLKLESAEAQLSAAQYIVEQQLTVAKAEQYIDAVLHPPEKPPVRRRTFILKDVRLFLNTITRGVTMMKTAGVNAACDRKETDDSICLTIRIPKQERV